MRLFRKFISLFRRSSLDSDMSEEMRLHLEARIEDNIAAGMPPEDARYAALRKFGGVEQAKERCRDQQRRGWLWLDHLMRDLRTGARVLLKEKGFFAVAVVVLALGIGGVTAQFSVINSALIRGLPFPEPERLVRVALRDPSWAPERTRPLFSRDFQNWAPELQSFAGLAGYWNQGSFIVTISEVPQRFVGAHVTESFFSLLGVKPALGRDFTADDQRQEAPRVTILSDALWRSEFEHDPNIIGRSVRLNGRTATIVGVMPPGFSFPRDQLWMPMFNDFMTPTGGDQGPPINVFGRLKLGVSADQAMAELSTLARRAEQEFPKSNHGLREVTVDPLLNVFVPRDARQIMAVMFAAVLAVLLIACLNVMTMQFARATRRAKELAVRGALGATRTRLIVQMLTESLLVAVAGGAAGAVVSTWALKFYTAGATGLPAWMTFDLDPRVLAFTVGATGASVLVAGLLPAFVASRANVLDVLKAVGRGHTSPLVNRVTGGLVIGQIALTAVLLVASLVLVKSVASRYALNFGFDLESVLVGRMNFTAVDPRSEPVIAAQREILRRLRTSPQISHAAFSTRRNSLLTAESRSIFLDTPDRPETQVWFEYVSDDYFATLGIRPLEGREFEPSDTSDKPLPALVNVSFARKFHPGASPLGHRFRLNPNVDRWHTIVGVVPDTQMQGALDARSDGAGVFLSAMSGQAQGYLSLVVRPRSAAPATLTDTLRREILAVNPHLPIYVVETPQQALSTVLAQVRTVTQLFGIFGLVAIVLSAIGLYGIAAFSVSQRTQEFGVRMALGAAPRQIMAMILRQGVRRLALGSALGLALAFALARVGSAAGAGLLYNVSPRDPAVYVLVIALLTAVALLACLLPARRATKVDPMVALRAE